MDIKDIPRSQFDDIVNANTRRAPYGQNQALLKKAEVGALELRFENEKKAISKLTALYVVRRKMKAQVKIVRRNNVLYIGPGDYLPTLRKSRHN
jgi:hypothetical protein